MKVRCTGKIHGFTLIELLAVVLVIVLVAALSLGVAKYANRQANISQTKALLAKLELGIDAFKLDNGYYPTTTIYRCSPVVFHAEKDNSTLLYSQLTSPKKYVTFHPTEIATRGVVTYIVDPWGTPINYYRPVGNFTNFVSSVNVTNYGYNTVSNAFYYVADWDNFTIGGLVNIQSYDLFSYGADKATYVPGARLTSQGLASQGWFGGWTTTNALDDIGNVKP